MKRIGLLTIGLALWSSGIAAAQTPEADAEAAKNQLLENKPREAAALYNSLVDRGFGSADVLYNLGVAEYIAGRRTQAIVQFERSLKQQPGAPDALANLRSLRNETEPSFFFVDKIEPWLDQVPADLAAYLLLGAHACFVLSLFFWWGRRERSGGAAAPLLSAFLLLLTLGAAGLVLAHRSTAADPRAVVLNDLRLEEGPDTRFDDAGPAKAGDRVRVVKSDGAWLQVQLRDGSKGWLPKDRIVRI